MPASDAQLELWTPPALLPPAVEDLRLRAARHLPLDWLDVVCAAEGPESAAILHTYRKILWAVPAPSMWRSYWAVFPDVPCYGGYLRARTGRDLSRSIRTLWGSPGQRRHLDHRAWKSWLAYAEALAELGERSPVVWVDGTVGVVAAPPDDHLQRVSVGRQRRLDKILGHGCPARCCGLDPAIKKNSTARVVRLFALPTALQLGCGAASKKTRATLKPFPSELVWPSQGSAWVPLLRDGLLWAAAREEPLAGREGL